MINIPACFFLINSGLCLALSCLLNGALLWLMARRTSVEMASTFRPILLLSTLVDLVYSAVFFVVRPVLLLDTAGDEQSGLWLSTGPLRWLPQPYNSALIAVGFLCNNFINYSLVAPFLFRYAHICRGRKKWGLRQFLTLLLLPSAASLVGVGQFLLAGYPRTEEDQRRAHEWLLLRTNGSIYFDNAGQQGTKEAANSSAGELQLVIPYFIPDQAHMRPFTTYVAASFTLTYTVVAICAWRIRRHLTRMAAGQVGEKQYRSLQLQLSTALLLQSVVPLVVGFAPSFAILLALFAGLDVLTSIIYVNAVYAWTPVVNPLIVMWVIKVYRDTIRQWVLSLRNTILCATPHSQQRATVHPVTTRVQVAQPTQQQASSRSPALRTRDIIYVN